MEYYDEDKDYDPENEESDNEESDFRNDGSKLYWFYHLYIIVQSPIFR